MQGSTPQLVGFSFLCKGVTKSTLACSFPFNIFAMNETQRAYLELHIAVLLFGITAILGDLIQLSAVVIVWWRVLITSISLVFLIRVGKLFREMPRRLMLQYMGIGVIVALHWIAFYGSIKVANASIALICMATTSFFTALLEPWILKQKIKGYELALGLLIVPGMALIVNNIDLSLLNGLYIGLISAFLAALFATFNKKLVGQAGPMSITFLELGSAWLFLSIVLPFFFWKTPEAQLWPKLSDWIYLLLLALLCTTLAYVLALRALNHISAFASNLTINLEPVYGIALAWLVLDDHKELTPAFYGGVAIILLAVFSYPFIRRYQRKRGR
jgi:drug/metabolite transporter (DMT)-like permease